MGAEGDRGGQLLSQSQTQAGAAAVTTAGIGLGR